VTPKERFPTTQLNLVLAAGEEISEQQAHEALAILCRTYWYPLYAFVRRQGYPPDEAQDLTQGFFTRLLEKNCLRDYQRERGRFRSFLLVSLKHFLSNERARARAQKRGGGAFTLPLDGIVQDSERRFSLEPRSNLTPEKAFERQWARAILDQSLERLRCENDHFDRLKGFLTGDQAGIPYRQLAGELDTTEGALKVAIHRVRRRFREVLREQIAHTVSHPREVQDEIRYLMAVLSAPL
jgi:RNA polymerase sigma-70 factor (ECF subfamily)